MTLDCVRLTQSGVIQTIHRNVGLKFFFIFQKRLFVIIVIHLYFGYISQGSVEKHLRSCGLYNCLIANCPQSVPVKDFLKSVHNWQIYGQK